MARNRYIAGLAVVKGAVWVMGGKANLNFPILGKFGGFICG